MHGFSFSDGTKQMADLKVQRFFKSLASPGEKVQSTRLFIIKFSMTLVHLFIFVIVSQQNITKLVRMNVNVSIYRQFLLWIIFPEP